MRIRRQWISPMRELFGWSTQIKSLKNRVLSSAVDHGGDIDWSTIIQQSSGANLCNYNLKNNKFLLCKIRDREHAKDERWPNLYKLNTILLVYLVSTCYCLHVNMIISNKLAHYWIEFTYWLLSSIQWWTRSCSHYWTSRNQCYGVLGCDYSLELACWVEFTNFLLFWIK